MNSWESDRRRRNATLTIWLLGCMVLLGVLMIASVSIGIVRIDLKHVYSAFFAFDEGLREHLIIVDTRLPRAIISVAVGASLAVSGAIMQGVTRNLLAAPEILGVNHGAALFVAFGIFFLGTPDINVLTWLALAGAGIIAAFVYLIGSLGKAGASPLKLTLVGVAMTTLSAAMIRVIMILNERTLDEMRFWLAGSVVGRDLQLFWEIAPYMCCGLLLALLLSSSLNLLSMGEDLSKALGQRIALVKFSAILTVVLLAGSSVALAGPIAFIGLAIPHIARTLTGSDYRWLLPFSAALGAILLLCADIAARFIIPRQELPVGIMTAIVGVPFFIHLARRRVHHV